MQGGSQEFEPPRLHQHQLQTVRPEQNNREQRDSREDQLTEIFGLQGPYTGVLWQAGFCLPAEFQPISPSASGSRQWPAAKPGIFNQGVLGEGAP